MNINAEPPASRSSGFGPLNSPKASLGLVRKEWLETLRDRRTLITLLGMPLLVYPLLAMALNRFLIGGGGPKEVPYRILAADYPTGEAVQRALDSPEAAPPDVFVDLADGNLAEFVVNVPDPSDPTPLPLQDILRSGGAELVVRTDPAGGFDVNAVADDPVSVGAARVFAERMLYRKVRSANVVRPFDVDVQLIRGDRSAPLLATVLPLVLVLMTITGAVYPAIDLTAGERERGTMEALIASPISPARLLTAKYVAVVTVAVLTAGVNLLAMFATLWLTGLLPLLTGGEPVSWTLPASVGGLLLLLAAFFSAILLTLTSFAKSFKEAQAYLIPVMLLAIAPGMLSLIPGTSIEGPLAVVPLVNITLLTRDLLSGQTIGPAAGVAVLSTVGYAAAALGLAGTWFGRNATDRTSGGSFAELFRRPAAGGGESPRLPTPTVAAAMLAMLVPTYFLCSNVLMTYLGDYRDLIASGGELSADQTVRVQVRSLILSAVTLTLVFGGVPLAVATWNRLNLKRTFRVRRSPFRFWAGALLLGLGSWTLAHEAFVVADAVGIGGLDAERVESTRNVLRTWTRLPPWLLLATLAATPAVIEELCFRGFLFRALRGLFRPAALIAVTAIIFGAFHVVTGNALLIERFVPTTLTGLLLGWLAFRSGSVLPGMLMHFTHNGLLNLLGHYHDRLAFLGDVEQSSHLPPLWLAVGVGLTLTGIGIIALGSQVRAADGAVAETRISGETV